MEREYFGEVSFTGRIIFGVRGKSKQEATEKIFDNIGLRILETTGDDSIEISGVEWELVNKPQGGNVQQTFVDKFYIEEEG